MTEKFEQEERLAQLLADREKRTLSFEEQKELQYLEENLDFEDWSAELAAAAIHLSEIEIDEPMPLYLQTKILADAEKFFAENTNRKSANVIPIGTKPKLSLVVNNERTEEKSDLKPSNIVEFPTQKARQSFFSGDFWRWSGWAVATAACLVLAVVLWNNQTVKPPEKAGTTPIETPKVLTVSEQREKFLRETGDTLKIDWAEPDAKKAKGITGDVVWSNTLQKGFIRFKGLPKNDVNKDTYQIWIGDANQRNPIDGGIFDVNDEGEAIIPIDAKLKVVKPQLFAVTMEQAGGVVVSKQDKLVLAAKVS